MTRTAVFRLVVVRQGDMSGKFPDSVTDQTLQPQDCAVRRLRLLSAARLTPSVAPRDAPPVTHDAHPVTHDARPITRDARRITRVTPQSCEFRPQSREFGP